MIYYLIIGVALHSLLFIGKPFRYHIGNQIIEDDFSDFMVAVLTILQVIIAALISLLCWPITIPAISIATVLRRQDYIDYLNGKEETE